jgi:hypothetical protein
MKRKPNSLPNDLRFGNLNNSKFGKIRSLNSKLSIRRTKRDYRVNYGAKQDGLQKGQSHLEPMFSETHIGSSLTEAKRGHLEDT